MLTVLIVLAAAVLVLLAGEAVRGQCRRMLSRPVSLSLAGSEPATQEAAA